MVALEDSKASVYCSRLFASLLENYEIDRKPLQIRARSIFPIKKPNSRATHTLHPYPAKVVQNIAGLILNTPQLCSADSEILDPFCGSGTILVESALNGLSAEGWDVNPFAVTLARAKTQQLDPDELMRLGRHVVEYAKRNSTAETPDVLNVNFWYDLPQKAGLSALAAGVASLDDSACHGALEIALSLAANSLSKRDPAVSVPVRHRTPPASRPDPLDCFYEAVTKIARHHADYSRLRSNEPRVRVKNRSVLEPVRNQAFDLVFTSPPYLGAQKYIRASYLSLGWLQQCGSRDLRRLEGLCIGREHYLKSEYCRLQVTGIDEADQIISRVFAENPLRSFIASSYLTEMRGAFLNIKGCLKVGGHFVLVTANNTLLGRTFPTTRFLQHILENELGLNRVLELVDPIPTRALFTKRRNQGSSSIIPHETISVYRRL